MFGRIENKLESADPGCWWYGFGFSLLSILFLAILILEFIHFL